MTDNWRAASVPSMVRMRSATRRSFAKCAVPPDDHLRSAHAQCHQMIICKVRMRSTTR